MKTIHDEWDNLIHIACMISEQFGNNCEVALHDLTGDFNSTIIYIKNGHVTGRTLGGCSSNIGLPVLSGHQEAKDTHNYITKTKSGKTLRSSTTYLRDPSGKVIGALCVNYDISNLLKMEALLQETIIYPQNKDEANEEVFANNVVELLDHITMQCQEYIGKPVESMTKEEKINAIDFFDKKGAFLISKAGEHICNYLQISKYTLYNYLKIAKAKEE